MMRSNRNFDVPKTNRIKKIVSYMLILLVIPLSILISFCVFGASSFVVTTVIVSALSVLAFILEFEKQKSDVRVLVTVSVMSALAILGRIIFAPFPGLKPVSAIIILCALYMGSRAGFLTGALTAVVSNFYFSQGPWTVVQMFVWGLIGFIAGLISSPLKKSKILLCIYGILSGIVFSLFMDVWSVIWMSGGFDIAEYAKAIYYALGFTGLYAVSNTVFLLILVKPVGGTLERLNVKYGIGKTDL